MEEKMAENEKQEKGNDGLPVEIERLVIASRLHEDDPTGHITGNSSDTEWEHLRLPMDVEVNEEL
jgi:hypothetical protein